MNDLLVSVYRLINIYNSKNRTAHTYGCGETLYPAQAHLLEAIGSHEGITLTDTASMLFITKAAVSQSIKQLCGMDLIRREDKRSAGGAQGLYLTEKGRSVYDEHRRRHSGMIQALDGMWSALSPEARESILEFISVTEKSILETEE